MPAFLSRLLASALILTMASAVAGAACAQGVASRVPTQWVTLGTLGGPVPDKSRSQPANLLIVNGTNYLVDAGNGVARQLAAKGLGPGAVGTIFVSHNHNDHNADVGIVMSIAWGAGRAQPIHVYGPKGTERVLQGFLQSFAVNAEIRMSEQPVALPPEKFMIAHDVVPGVIFQDANVKVTAMENSHFHFRSGSPAENRHISLALRFETADRVIVYTGDTGPNEALVAFAKDADLLVSEVISLPEMEKFLLRVNAPVAMREGAMRHFREDHLGPEDVGKLASQANVKQVVLTHLVPNVADQELERVYLEGVKRFYNGSVVVATDGAAF